MKKSLGFWLFVLIPAFLNLPIPAASGQSCPAGYEFGVGFNFADASGRGRVGSREQLPYFAQFPPVYYSHISPRPYGVSPFAAPPGILPIEMTIPVLVTPPKKISNPHFDQQPTEAPDWLADEPEVLESSGMEKSPEESKTVPEQNSYSPEKLDLTSVSQSRTPIRTGHWHANPFYGNWQLSNRR